MTQSEGSPLVLVVDDEAGNRELLRRWLTRSGCRIDSVGDGESALSYIKTRRPDLVLLDVVLPGMDGFEICRRIKAEPSSRLTPVVLVTGLEAREHKIEGILAGADDFLSKPIDSAELSARVASLVRIKRYTDELDSAESVILSLALTVEARDPYTDGHCQRLAGYAVAFGEHLGLSDEVLAALRRGGYLHDVGKIGVPDAVLLKSDPLTAAEYEIAKRHTVIGERLCGDLRSLTAVRTIVRHHHERANGSGYPDGLRGNEIPLTAQIIAIVDTYDAITANRPYRAAQPIERAFDELQRDAEMGRHSRELVGQFLSIGEKGTLQRIAGEIAARLERSNTKFIHGLKD